MKKGFSPLLGLLVAILFIRAIIPTGFMPDLSGNHVLVICTEFGFSNILVDKDNQPIPNHSHKQASDFCPFSLFANTVLASHNNHTIRTSEPLIKTIETPVLSLAGISSIFLQSNHPSRAPPKLL